MGAARPVPFGMEQALQQVKVLSFAELERLLEAKAGEVVIHVGGSDEFAAGHIPGSRWVPRGYLEARIGNVASSKQEPVIVTCTDGQSSAFAGATLRALGYEDVSILDGGITTWRTMGLPLETGLTGVMSPPDDVLAPSRSFADMMQYLRWEVELGHKYE
jgi:rhodanese-related sulfurtransferase